MVSLEKQVVEILDNNNPKEYPYSDLSYQVIGCAMKVLNYYGPWYVEYVYQKGLELVLKKTGIPFIAKEEIPIYFEGERTGAVLKPDFLIDDKIIVEIKALPELNQKNIKQILSYMKAAEKELGLLINFGTTHLEVKRYILSNKE